MRKSILIAALLGVLLVAAPFGKLVQAEDEPDVDEAAEAPEEPEEAVDETDVVVLKVANWDEIVGKSKYALVGCRSSFDVSLRSAYRITCPPRSSSTHRGVDTARYVEMPCSQRNASSRFAVLCQSLKPEWAKAATALKAIDASVVIAKVIPAAATSLRHGASMR
jgi:hypothetical protein